MEAPQRRFEVHLQYSFPSWFQVQGCGAGKVERGVGRLQVKAVDDQWYAARVGQSNDLAGCRAHRQRAHLQGLGWVDVDAGAGGMGAQGQRNGVFFEEGFYLDDQLALVFAACLGLEVHGDNVFFPGFQSQGFWRCRKVVSHCVHQDIECVRTRIFEEDLTMGTAAEFDRAQIEGLGLDLERLGMQSRSEEQQEKNA